jgi:hypothetical protein
MIIPNKRILELVKTGLESKGMVQILRKVDEKQGLEFLIYEGPQHVNFLFKSGKEYSHHYCQFGDEIAIERFIVIEKLEERDQSFYAKVIAKMRMYKS